MSIEISSVIISSLITIVVIEMILPFLRNQKQQARDNLDRFYNIAYAFVRIRDKFSIPMKDGIHDKENCGFFHSFNSTGGDLPSNGIVFNEAIFLDFASKNLSYMSEKLKETFISYFKVRGVDIHRNNNMCHDEKMILLRKEIEYLIESDYEYYRKKMKSRLLSFFA